MFAKQRCAGIFLATWIASLPTELQVSEVLPYSPSRGVHM